MILIKNQNILIALLNNKYHPLLINLLTTFQNVAENSIVTEGWREGGGVHSTDPCRGMDLRSWIYSYYKVKEILKYVNDRWIYDPNRPTMKCLVLHDAGKGIHFHLQVHPNTQRRKGL